MMNRRKAPWAAWTPYDGLAGGTITGAAKKITLHTTEGDGYPNWAVIRSIPHLTVNPADGRAWQHLDFDRSGYALGSPGAPKSPNMNAGIHIQIEVIARAANTPTYGDRWYKKLAVWLAWLCSEWEVPQNFPFPFGGNDGYGTSGKYRQPWELYRDASGIVGHSNAPFNTHWDPGNLNKEKLLGYMKEETVVAITNKDANLIAEKVAARVNRVLGDFNSSGEPNQGVEKPELASKKIRQIEKIVRRIEQKLDEEEPPKA